MKNVNGTLLGPISERDLIKLKQDSSFFWGGIVRIGEFAFSDCKDLIEIEIPSGVLEIGSNAFSGCDNLTKIIIPDSIEKITTDAFANLKNLKEIKLEYVSSKFIKLSGNSFDKLYEDNLLKLKNLLIKKQNEKVSSSSGNINLNKINTPTGVTNKQNTQSFNSNANGYNAADTQFNKPDGKYIYALLASIGFGILGGLCWALVYMIGYLSVLVGFVMVLLVGIGYDLCKGPKGKPRTVTIILVSAIILILTILLTFTIDVMIAANGKFGFGECIKLLFEMIRKDSSVRTYFTVNIILSILFCGGGLVYYFQKEKIKQSINNNKNNKTKKGFYDNPKNYNK